MKILVQNRDRNTHFGGDQVQVDNYVKSLINLGHDAIYSCDSNLDLSSYDEVWLVHINYDWSWRQYQNIRKYNKQYRLFAMYYPWHVHNSQEQMKELLSNSIATYALSNVEKGEMISGMQLNQEQSDKIITIPNGIDETIFYKTDEPKEDFIMSSGRYESLKGFDCIAKAAQELNLPVKFFGSLGDALFKEQLQSNYPNAECYDNLSQIELADYLRKCRLYVCASHGERFHMGMSEALACGARVVNSPQTRGNEWFPGITIAEPNNNEELKNAILKEWNHLGTEYTFNIQTWNDVIKTII